MFNASKFRVPTPRLDGSTLWGSGHTNETLEPYRAYRSKYLGHALSGSAAFMLGRKKPGAKHTAIIFDSTVYIVEKAPLEVWKAKTDTVVSISTGFVTPVDSWNIEGYYGWGMKIVRRLNELEVS